ncbi:carboxylesterase/lipase family protein [Streptosporangium saharense]|uniref:Carboxylic ester hydrolase n=1 Tax=Streptosporangium saharense TaxID=1706840 RepID=A0A7W7QV96_9ACTN|nr:carboxylesterase family protein [Streptosporangium saharense]MBB4920418.1 para-nitrobenzyl esterase [Streptosporangium saharense]
MIVDTASGLVRGRIFGDISAFLGIPYAVAERFARPRPAPAWPGVLDATAPGPAAPQTPSRLERVMGPMAPLEQAEDCLSLNVWAPRDARSLPVLVFLHGGGYSSGSGGLPWYGGAHLAGHGDIVVVTVNYRLGALGFLCLPGVSEGNLGLRDKVEALRWVRENIAAFGGDPGAVTVAGQSGGAFSTLCLLSGNAADGLFTRAILQSAPLGMAPRTPERAAEIGALLLEELGSRDPREAPVADLLAAQTRVALRAGRPLDPEPPFHLVADGELVAADPVTTVAENGTKGVSLVIGTTRDETEAFYALDDRVAALGPEHLAALAQERFGDPSRAEGRTASELVTEHMFDEPTRRLTGALADPVWVYRFDWHPEGSPYGACHCLELPFLLGDPQAWRDAPMLAGQPPPEALATKVRTAWTDFVRHGDPGWAPYPTVHHFVGEEV